MPKKTEDRTSMQVEARADMMLAYLMERPEIALLTLGALCQKYEDVSLASEPVSRPRLSLVVSDRVRDPKCAG